MKFRKLYWVTEQLDSDGRSEIAGVYTSIPDLVERGAHWCAEIDKTAHFRLSLVKLDSNSRPLGSWTSPAFEGIEDDLATYVETQEMTTTEIEGLVESIRSIGAKS